MSEYEYICTKVISIEIYKYQSHQTLQALLIMNRFCKVKKYIIVCEISLTSIISKIVQDVFISILETQ